LNFSKKVAEFSAREELENLIDLVKIMATCN
jgi:hypothetical protein